LSANGPDRPQEFRLGAGLPERYAVNRERYISRGGLVRLPEDLRGFLANELNAEDMARFYTFCLVFDQIVKEGLKGDIAELGVYKGHTASLLATMARRLGRTVYLLDTFTGFSEADLKGIDTGVPMGFADTSVEAVRELVGEKNVAFAQGYFPDSASQLPPDATYCLVHIDCDLYAPMLSALEYFYPRLVPGGFLIMHDYSSLHWNGAERAVDEFFAERAESAMPLPDRAGSVVVRKVRVPERFDNWFVQRNARLFGPDWTPAAGGKLAAVLGDGWSTGESWGLWGIDEAHQIFVFLAGPPTSDIELEFDVNAMLVGSRTRQDIDVFVDGHLIETWEFTPRDNQKVRSLRIPLTHLTEQDQSGPILTVEFRPRLVATPHDLDPSLGDGRRLGLALHRVRRTL
jgi:hypothetical protein